MESKSLLFAAMLFVGLPASVQAADSFDFRKYRVDYVYKGKLSLPDFGGRDSSYAIFKTRITDAMKKGVTFAGEYSIAEFGCGTGCISVFVANNKTGQLHDFPRGGEFNQALTLEYELTSNLVLARWYADSFWETCVIEAFLFEEGKWIAKGALAGKGEEICEGQIAVGAARIRSGY